MTKTLDLAQQLIAKRSITPDDAECQKLLSEKLAALDFEITHLPFGDVRNFFAKRGNQAPSLIFLGHTDVVPTGPLEHWTTPPFEPNIKNGLLYGRGAADMKGSLAAMVVACENFVANHPEHIGSIGFIITSDEEGPSVDGTRKVIEYLQSQNQTFDYCIVGEPTSDQQFGDTIKYGRRGSLSGNLIIHGIQGHIAYPYLADNPIHRASAAITQLCAKQWDQGNAHFPATSFQISNIHAGTGAGNVIPEDLNVQFNFRFCNESNAAQLQHEVESILKSHQLKFDLTWRHSGDPYLTQTGELTDAIKQAIYEVTQVKAELSTTGGTSDGRFVAPTGCQVIEFGPINSSIHKIDECVGVEELEQLTKVYTRVLEILLLA